MAEHPNWERHWSTISLGIVTVATAAIGAAFFAIDLTEVVTSLITYFLVVIAISVYLWVLILGGRSIFSTSDEAILLERPNDNSPRHCTAGFSWDYLSWQCCLSLRRSLVYCDR